VGGFWGAASSVSTGAHEWPVIPDGCLHRPGVLGVVLLTKAFETALLLMSSIAGAMLLPGTCPVRPAARCRHRVLSIAGMLIQQRRNRADPPEGVTPFRSHAQLSRTSDEFMDHAADRRERGDVLLTSASPGRRTRSCWCRRDRHRTLDCRHYMFLHANLWHLLFNMLGLLFFGPRLEAELAGGISCSCTHQRASPELSFRSSPPCRDRGGVRRSLRRASGLRAILAREQIMIWGIIRSSPMAGDHHGRSLPHRGLWR